MKLISALINSNIYISLAAVSLTVAAQIQLGMKPRWHPYLFIIFFATLFEYNLHRLVTILTNKEALESDKHRWVKENTKPFYTVVAFSVLGFISVAFIAKREVLITLAPIALLTLLYSIPFSKHQKNLFRLREIPFLKIFVISFVWSVLTIFFPVIHAEETFNRFHIAAMFVERFLFVFAITIPFDIRDMEVDRKAGLKTIPVALGESKALFISYTALVLFLLISWTHYRATDQWFLAVALSVSAITTFIFLQSGKIRKWNFYHYGILDGTMLLQGGLVILLQQL